MSDEHDEVLSEDDARLAALFRDRRPSAPEPAPARLHVVQESENLQQSADDRNVGRGETLTGSSPSSATVPGTRIGAEPQSVLDAMALTRDRLVEAFKQQAANGTIGSSSSDGVLSPADRLAVEEAWAKAGIPTLATPRGLIELTKGILEAEEWRRIIDAKTELEIKKFQSDLSIIQAGWEDAIALKKLTGDQTIKLQTLTGEGAQLSEAMKVEEIRLQKELAELGAKVKRIEEKTGRRIAELEAELRAKSGEIDAELAAKKLDADREIKEYQQTVDIELARIKAIRTDSDIRRTRFRAKVYANKEWVYLAVLVLVVIVGLVFLVAR